MSETRNLCAQLPLALHAQVCEERERAGLTTAQYMTQLITVYYEMKKNGGNATMANNGSRTLAFQVSEDLFQRLKQHLERETARTGRKLTQRQFILGLIEKALDESEQQADVGPCEAPVEQVDAQHLDED